MRTSILSRSVIAIATLAIGSVVLAATPATAATAAGVTRDQVLALSAYDRNPAGPSDAAVANALDIGRKTCPVGPNEKLTIQDVNTTPAGPHADGFAIILGIRPIDGGPNAPWRECFFGAVAVTDPAFTLSGAASVDVASEPWAPSFASAVATPLSGDVYVTPPVVVAEDAAIVTASFSASGNATRSYPVTTTQKVAVKRTTAQKKKAKATYAKQLKAAKKSYAKALKAAGKNKTKKTAAKKSYTTKRASATAKYRAAIATSKTVTRTITQTENRPFSVRGGFDYRS